MERLPEHSPVPRLRRAHVRAVGLDPRAKRHIVRFEGIHKQRQLIGWGCHVRIGKDDQVGLGGAHARTHGRALARVRHDEDPQRGPSFRVRRGLQTGTDELGGPIRTAVVDHQDFDRVRQLGGTRRPVATDRIAVFEVAEQFVEGRADPLRLVEGRKHDREALRRCHIAGSLVVARNRGTRRMAKKMRIGTGAGAASQGR